MSQRAHTTRARGHDVPGLTRFKWGNYVRGRDSDRGETLVEVLIAIVLIGVISSAYFVTASTQTRASSLNKELVQADAVARSYAELSKAAVRNGCTAGAPLTIDTSSFPSGYTATAPS